MADIHSINPISTADLLAQKTGKTAEAAQSGFSEKLKNALGNAGPKQTDGEKTMSDIVTGSVKDLHQAAIAIDKAEISMKLMLEVRNKALSAYKEITRTQI